MSFRKRETARVMLVTTPVSFRKQEATRKNVGNDLCVVPQATNNPRYHPENESAPL